jgi:hypothetical protein
MMRRLGTIVVTALVTGLLVFSAAPASAVTWTRSEVLYNLTRTDVDSYNLWNAARLKPSIYPYDFSWQTDYCSASPDKPLGFDFKLSCHRHDWGHRNYKDIGQLEPNRSRIDLAFYEDMKRKCATYSVWVRSACYSLAWSYYQAVVVSGTLSVSKADLDRAAHLKAQGEAARAAASGRSSA